MDEIIEVATVRAMVAETDTRILKLNLELGLFIAEGMNDPVFVKEGTALRVQERVQ